MEKKTAFDSFVEINKVNLSKELKNNPAVNEEVAYLCLNYAMNFLSGVGDKLLGDEEKTALKKIWRKTFQAFCRLEAGLQKIQTFSMLDQLIDLQ